MKGVWAVSGILALYKEYGQLGSTVSISTLFGITKFIDTLITPSYVWLSAESTKVSMVGGVELVESATKVGGNVFLSAGRSCLGQVLQCVGRIGRIGRIRRMVTGQMLEHCCWNLSL